MRESFIKILDTGMLKRTMEYVTTHNLIDQIPTYIKSVRVTMVVETNRFQSLFLCELLGSYSIQSQRYCRYDENLDNNNIFEHYGSIFTVEEQTLIKDTIKTMTDLYLDMTKVKEGCENKTKFTSDDFVNNIPIDDGRYILPMSYICNTEMTLNGEQFLKFILLIYSQRGIFGDLYFDLIEDLKQFIQDDAIQVLVTTAILMVGESRVVGTEYFNDLLGDRYNHGNIYLLDNECEYSPMHKSGAGALMCTTSDVRAMDVVGKITKESEQEFKKITERVVVCTHHTSVSEHASFTFAMKQSIPCYNQYVRHRHQETLREDFNLDLIKEEGMPIIIPASINDNGFRYKFIEVIEKVNEVITTLYNNTISDSGSSLVSCTINELRLQAIKQLIPMGYELRVVCTTNIVNELYKGTKRICNKAHWEIGNITRESLSLIKEKIGDDNKLLNMAKPRCCTPAGCGEGKFTCGDNENVLKLFNMNKQ